MVTCDNKWILYDNQQWSTQWFDHEEAPKHFPKPNLHEKKVMVTVWRSVAHLIHYSVQDPGKTITSEKYVQQTDEMHQKLQGLQPALVNKMGPVLHNSARPPITQPALQRLNELGYEVLPHLPCSPDLSPTDYHQASWQLWAWKMLPQPAGGRKCFLRVHRIPKYGFLCYRNKQTYFSWAKMCWL